MPKRVFSVIDDDTGPTYRPKRRRARAMRRPRKIVPGFTRRSGYYKRYSRAAQMLGEKKFLDTAIGLGAVGSALEKQNLVIVPQGDTESQRIGRKCRVKKLYVKGSLKMASAAAAANTSERVRVFILLDTQTNGATFGATDLLETDDINSFNNLANSSRFRILKSKTFIFSAGGGTETGATHAFSEVIKPVKIALNMNHIIEYDNTATTGAITTQRSNSLWLCAIAQEGNLVSLAGQARIRYLDM